MNYGIYYRQRKNGNQQEKSISSWKRNIEIWRIVIFTCIISGTVW